MNFPGVRASRSEVSELETPGELSGIVIARFWWACSGIHIDMVKEVEGRPNWQVWGPVSYPHQAFHWASKPAAYKYLRENPELADAGYRVHDLHDIDWPVLTWRVPADKGKDGAE